MNENLKELTLGRRIAALRKAQGFTQEVLAESLSVTAQAVSKWENDPDDLLTVDDIQQAERLTPPITEARAKELFTALRDSKYLLRGLPLVSIESPDGTRTRIDL